MKRIENYVKQGPSNAWRHLHRKQTKSSKRERKTNSSMQNHKGLKSAPLPHQDTFQQTLIQYTDELSPHKNLREHRLSLLPSVLMMFALLPKNGLANEVFDSAQHDSLAVSGNASMPNINRLPAAMSHEWSKNEKQAHHKNSMSYDINKASVKEVKETTPKILEQAKRGTFNFKYHDWQKELSLTIDRHGLDYALGLIEGADVSVMNEKGQMPLHQAIDAYDGKIDDKVIFAIMKETPDLNVKDIDFNNPLTLSLMRGHDNITIKLLEAGADYSHAASQGGTLKYLIINLHSLPLIEALISQDYYFSQKNEKRQSLLHQMIDTYDRKKDDKAIFAVMQQTTDLNARDAYGNNALDVSFIHGHDNIAAMLIEAGADYAGVKIDCQSVREWAIQNHNLPVIKALISRGLDVNAVNEEKQCLLHQMIDRYDRKKDDRAIFAVMEETADLNALDHYGNSLLAISLIHGHGNIAAMLIEEGADYVDLEVHGKSVREWAIKIHSLQLIKVLIARGLDVNRKNEKGQSFLHQMIDTYDHRKDDKAILAIMKATTDLNARDVYDNNPLGVSLIHGHDNIAAMLIEAGADYADVKVDGKSVLEWAIQEYSLPLINALTARGLVFNTVNEKGQSLLHQSIISYREHYNENIIMAIMNATTDLNVEDDYDNTPLTASLILGHNNIAAMLIEAGADYADVKVKGKSVLEWAIQDHSHSLPMINALITRGLDVNRKNERGQSLLHQVIDTYYHGDDDKAILAIMKASTDLNARDEYGNNPLSVSLIYGLQNIAAKLIEEGADYSNVMVGGKSVLELAIQEQSLVLINALIASGFDVNKVNAKGQSLLHQAIDRYFPEQDDKAILAIMKATTDLNVQDDCGNTPLTASLILGHEKIAINLIEAGADLSIVNADLISAIELILQRHSLPLIEAVIARGVDVNTVNAKGQSLLQQAIEVHESEKDDKAILAIMKATTDLNVQDVDGHTPLSVSLLHGFENIAVNLIEAGADYSVVKVNGMSMIEWAIEENRLALVNAVMARRRDVDTKYDKEQCLLPQAIDTEDSEEEDPAIFSMMR